MKPGAHFIRAGSVAESALLHLSSGECIARSEVVAHVLPQAKSQKYADEVMTMLLQRGFIRSSLMQITDKGREALAALEARQEPRKKAEA